MTGNIEAILFDMGGTLRTTVKRSKAEKVAAVGEILKILGSDRPLAAFYQELMKRARGYKHWAQQTMVELNERDLWTQWMLPDFPVDQVEPLAVTLNQMYRDALGTRVLFPESREVLLSLYRRGYRLGLVSNTTSSVEVPAALREMQLTGCFEVVVLSAVVGKRKPDPAILLEAASRMGVAPEGCAYIGDRPDRDVAAARSAGFQTSVLIGSKRGVKTENTRLLPDHEIQNLKELLAIFPQREPPRAAVRYRASLSTMWAFKNFPTLPDFFEFAARSGLAEIELNHQVDSRMLEGVDFGKHRFSSIHEPCPADISLPELTKRDWLISSLDEEKRREGVRAVMRSIDLAKRIGARVVVVHPGTTNLDAGYEKRLRELYTSGRRDSVEFGALNRLMREARAEIAPPFVAAVKRSLLELLAHAEGTGIRLGLENRYHYREIPNPDEMQEFRALAGADRLGMILDVGHAYVLERLGFYPFSEWLERFSRRIIGTHLHDVSGLTDHYSAGSAEIDLRPVGAVLPPDAVRTLEYNEGNSPEVLIASIHSLRDTDCIQIL